MTKIKIMTLLSIGIFLNFAFADYSKNKGACNSLVTNLKNAKKNYGLKYLQNYIDRQVNWLEQMALKSNGDAACFYKAGEISKQLSIFQSKTQGRAANFDVQKNTKHIMSSMLNLSDAIISQDVKNKNIPMPSFLKSQKQINNNSALENSNFPDIAHEKPLLYVRKGASGTLVKNKDTVQIIQFSSK
jgi:hypothetical protein